jgi:hypothetical protein
MAAVPIIWLRLVGARDQVARIRSRDFTAVAVLGISTAIGALYQHPLGWYAALSLAGFNALNTVIGRHFGTGRATRWISIVFVAANAALILVLVTAPGRRAFHLVTL